MSINIERLRFYERQYLRSFDWIAEQTYHLEMRRRLNLALHLWGIVDGLEILQGVLTPGAPAQFHISPGMAIDAYGREIFLFSPYPFSEDDLLANRIATPGTYAVWIAYHRQPSRPPAPGYRLCDVKDQYTRWRETYRIIISNNPGPTTPPKFTDALSDDPDKNTWQVRLGSIVIDNVGGQLIITTVVSEQRTYIGLRAQHIVTPVATPATPLVDPILNQIGPRDAPLSLSLEADAFAEKNVIVGNNFAIDKTKIKPTPAPATFPSSTGNLKVASDLFLRGNLYASEAGEWLGLQEYVRRLTPDIQMGTMTLPIAPTAVEPSNGTQNFTLTSKLTNPSSAQMLAVLSGIECKSIADLTTWFATVSVGTPMKLEVSAAAPTKQAGSTNVYDVAVSWSVGPKDQPANPNDAMLNVNSLMVSYIAVFFP